MLVRQYLGLRVNCRFVVDVANMSIYGSAIQAQALSDRVLLKPVATLLLTLAQRLRLGGGLVRS